MNIISTDLEANLKSQELFRDVKYETIKPILMSCPVRQLNAGESLITIGSSNRLLFLILAGSLRVHLATDMVNPVAILDAGQSVGEISIIDQQPASANVIADTDCQLLVVEESALWRLIEQSHAISINMLRVLSQRLRYGNSMINKIKDLLQEYEYNATIDPLTSLYNRRWLDNMIGRVLHRCQSNQQTLSVMMLDIDYFKQFNDNHGHLGGDCALRAISHTIVESLRPEDLITRYGGEELFAILPGLGLNAARQVAERLRAAVSDTRIIQTNGRELPGVTISIGVAEMEDSDSPESLIERADKALYRAKENGRDCVAD